MINPITQGYGVQSVGAAPLTSRTAPSSSSTDDTGDTVTISEEARAMNAAAAAEKDSATPSLAPLSEVMPLLTAEELNNKTEEVQSRVTALLLERNIPTNPPVDLYMDEAGAVRVKGDSPYKKEIEQALAEDENLSNDFRLVSAQTTIQEAGKRHSAFAAAYAKDPEAAVARFAYLFDNIPDDPYTMTIGGGEEA